MTSRKSQALSLTAMLFLAAALATGTTGCPKKPVKAKPTPVETPAPTPEPTPVADDGGVGGTGQEPTNALEPEDCLKAVLFELDSSTLSSDSTTALKSAAACLNANTGWKVTIEGHADERGSTQYNIALGERRARSVSDYLANAGVDKNRLSTVSFGEEKPVDPGHDEGAWGRNRRVEFRVKK